MHELGITRSIVAIACEHAGRRRVRAVHLRVGALTGVDAGAIEFCYDLCTEGTVAAGSKLIVERIAGAGRCTGCEADLPLDAPLALCPCERRAPLVRTAGDTSIAALNTVTTSSWSCPLESTDALMIWICWRLVLRYWSLHAATMNVGAELPLCAGRSPPIGTPC